MYFRPYPWFTLISLYTLRSVSNFKTLVIGIQYTLTVERHFETLAISI